VIQDRAQLAGGDIHAGFFKKARCPIGGKMFSLFGRFGSLR
jgi:hypothetical protein